MRPRLARIDIYPIKSLDSLTVQAAQVLDSGALQHDRSFALFDSSDTFVNGKRNARIHQVRSRFSEDCQTVELWTEPSKQAHTFHLAEGDTALTDWFSDFFQQPIAVRQNLAVGFPDDTDSPGPTVISTATLQTVADWYKLSLEETRLRFRTNLEIDGVPAFWEDQLFSASGEPVPFCIGKVEFQGINPCQRCVVPTRDPQTGGAISGFQKQFMEKRAATLPDTVARSRFNHFFRLAVNTQLRSLKNGVTVHVGDSISPLG